MNSLTTTVFASVAKQSRAVRDTLWIATSPAAPRNDEGLVLREGSAGTTAAHFTTVTPAQAGAESGEGLCPASLGPGLRRDDERAIWLEGSVG